MKSTSKRNFVEDRKAKRKCLKGKGKLNALSFFSGAMGLDIGLEQAGINFLLACEINSAARKTIVANDEEIGLIGDIRDYTTKQILEFANIKKGDKVHLIVGGPPCQAFSTAGKRMGFQDERGNVFLRYIDLILDIQPEYAVIENVRGLMSSTITIDLHDEITAGFDFDIKSVPGSTLFYVIKKLEAGGYHVKFNLYNSANFGTPQVRERVIIICTKLNNPVPYLEPTHSSDSELGLPKWRTFKDAVKGINAKKPTGGIQFSANRLKYIKMLKAGENWRNLPKEVQEKAMGGSYHLGGGKTGFYRRLAWDKPSPTLVTHPAMPATELAHPVEDRPLSVDEYKAIQEFPKTWKIEGSTVDQYKQIGNAVPVGVGRAIGELLNKHVQGKKVKQIAGFKYSRYNSTSDTEWMKEFVKSAHKINGVQIKKF